MIYENLAIMAGFTSHVVRFEATHRALVIQCRSDRARFELVCSGCVSVKFEPVWTSRGPVTTLESQCILLRDVSLEVTCKEVAVFRFLPSQGSALLKELVFVKQQPPLGRAVPEEIYGGILGKFLDWVRMILGRLLGNGMEATITGRKAPSGATVQIDITAVGAAGRITVLCDGQYEAEALDLESDETLYAKRGKFRNDEFGPDLQEFFDSLRIKP